MSKLIGLALAVVLPILIVKPDSAKFQKYKSVETYEIQSGILMMPRYSEDGQVCEIGLEKRHYSPEEIYLDSTLSREEIDQIADELAPANERGPRTMGDKDLVSEVGHGLTTISAYENISIEIYSRVLPTSRKREIVADDVAATIKWNNRRCQ
jgi:hypothetical protein